MDTLEGKAPQVWANCIVDYANFDMYACLAQTERAAASIRLELDLAKAAADADLVIESMAERAGAAGEDSPCDKLVLAAALEVRKLYRAAGSVSRAALCKLHLEKQHGGDHGTAEDQSGLV